MPGTLESDDARFMQRAITLAYLGEGLVEPNPMVGCVVVHNGRILAEGYHERFGGPHAEVNALRQLTASDVVEATLYVTLEPCSHFGKTPPCVELVADLRPKRVVIGTIDPFPANQGRAIETLRKAGIAVDVGIEESSCRRLIAPFARGQIGHRPWVIAKWAMTIDGRTATQTGDSQWISSEAARQHAHRIRGRVDAIIVGIETAIADDPMLTARPSCLRVAKRIVIDSEARLPITSKLVATSNDIQTIVVSTSNADRQRVDALTARGCKVLEFDSDREDRLRALLQYLHQHKCTNVLIDGGARLVGGFIDADLVDEFHIYVGDKLVGGQPSHVPNLGIGWEKLRESPRLGNMRLEAFADNSLFIAYDRQRE